MNLIWLNKYKYFYDKDLHFYTGPAVEVAKNCSLYEQFYRHVNYKEPLYIMQINDEFCTFLYNEDGWRIYKSIGMFFNLAKKMINNKTFSELFCMDGLASTCDGGENEQQ